MLRLEEEERDRHELLLAQELGHQLDFEEGAAAAAAAAAAAHHPSQPRRVA
jgi:dsDNA-specific endonuclease/ATPase MutS2